MMVPVLEGLAFDDVLMLPNYSEVLPHEADLTCELMPGIELKLPVLSAAMDTVTTARMAVALAAAGGLGFIHKNMGIEQQCSEVRQVKSVLEGGKLAKQFSTILNQNSTGQAVLLAAAAECSAELALEASAGHPPPASGDSPQPSDVEQTRPNVPCYETEVSHACVDSQKRLRVGAAVGCAPDSLVRARALVEAGVDVLLVDSSHGHSKGVMETIRALRAEWPRGKLPLVAGNTCTPEGVEALFESGADCVKVGIGPGSICTTRIVTGCGCPQFTTVQQCATAARRLGITIIADGGMRFSGDIAKALAAGASAVMLGGMLAGTLEAPGEQKLVDGRLFKTYRGMGSEAAMKKGSADRYFQATCHKFVPEGVEGLCPYKGPVADTIYQISGGLRAAMGLLGCGHITDMWTRTRFVHITGAALQESHPHTLTSIKSSLNYSTL